jgi:hypothetical protein
MTANPKDSTESTEKKGPIASIKEKYEDNEDRFAILSTFVRLGILVWSGSILTLAYIKLPAYLKIPEQKLDPTFIASVFTGVLATFGVQTAKKGAAAAGGITKAQLQELMDKAAQTAPAQTIRIEQAPVVLKPDAKTD